MSARVIALHLHRARGERPVAVGEAAARVGGGLEGDSHAANARRAVLVIDRATHDALGLVPGDLREQVTIEGLPDVTALAAGTHLRVGSVTLEVHGPCKPCTHIGEMLEVADPEALRLLLEGRRGAVCTVVAADAPLRIGDRVEVLSPAPIA